jgi:hypothetical protein
MKQQTEEIEYKADRKIVEKYQKIPEYKGCKLLFCLLMCLVESSIGMSKSRISDIGRRLVTADDEKKLPFHSKPGYTWGNSTRSTPKAVSQSLFLFFYLVGHGSSKTLAKVQLCTTTCCI